MGVCWAGLPVRISEWRHSRSSWLLCPRLHVEAIVGVCCRYRRAPLPPLCLAPQAPPALLGATHPQPLGVPRCRIVDVSTLGELCRRWFPREHARAPKKKNTHTAMSGATRGGVEGGRGGRPRMRRCWAGVAGGQGPSVCRLTMWASPADRWWQLSRRQARILCVLTQGWAFPPFGHLQTSGRASRSCSTTAARYSRSGRAQICRDGARRRQQAAAGALQNAHPCQAAPAAPPPSIAPLPCCALQFLRFFPICAER